MTNIDEPRVADWIVQEIRRATNARGLERLSMFENLTFVAADHIDDRHRNHLDNIAYMRKSIKYPEGRPSYELLNDIVEIADMFHQGSMNNA